MTDKQRATPSYDTITVLGSQPDTTTWKFPFHVYDSLDLAAQLFKEGMAPSISLSGNYAIGFDFKGVKQPYREADKMAEYLQAKQSITADKLLIEHDSKDTIANLYELKNKIYRPHGMKHILFIVADYRLPRLYFLTHKILGDSYQVELRGVPCSVSGIADKEAYAFEIQSRFLAAMAVGDDHWLDGKFYTDPHYTALYHNMRPTPK